MERPAKEAKKSKNKPWKVFLLVFLGLTLLFISGLGIFVCKFPLVARAAYNFIASPSDQVNTTNGRINILVMGKSGGNHEGADLTDSIILVSIPVSDGMAKTISIPRDLWLPNLKSKINSVYYWGNEGTAYFTKEETGGGISFTKKIVGDVVGQPIQYAVVVDFSAFKEIVDAFGGIEVNVENDFTDTLYPIEGKENDTCNGDISYACRYEAVTFYSGVQTMNGETALKFVRSRHAEGDEGTDIAREARQQKVIEAIKNKLTNPLKYLSPGNISVLLSIVEKYVETDIDYPTAGILVRKVWDSSNIEQFTLPEEFLENPKATAEYDNLYVFIPKAGNGNWSEIQKWFASVLTN